MRAVSLFSGAGGMDWGLERAGIQTVLQAEIDPWALAVLRCHWPDVRKVEDVRDVARTVPDTLGERGRDADADTTHLSLVFGGWPCQGNSVAGKRGGMDDERSGLWSEFRRVVRELRPRWVLAENVPGLLSVADGRDFAGVLCDLEELGYGWAYRILDARHFGVPQRRRRVFIVGCAGGLSQRAAQVLAVCAGCGGHPAPRRAAGEAASGEAGERAAVAGFNAKAGDPDTTGYVEDATPPLTVGGQVGIVGDIAATLRSRQHAPGVNPPGRGGEDDDNLIVAKALRAGVGGTMSDDKDTLVLAHTLTASMGHHGHSSPRGQGSDNLVVARSLNTQQRGVGDPSAETFITGTLGATDLTGNANETDFLVDRGMLVRRLMPVECERLMSWPDDWTRWVDDGREISDSVRYRLIGNGVVSNVAEYIGRRLVVVDAMLGAHEAGS